MLGQFPQQRKSKLLRHNNLHVQIEAANLLQIKRVMSVEEELTLEEKEILELWKTGESRCKEEALRKIENLYEFRRGVMFYNAFKEGMMDFINTMDKGRAQKSWHNILFHAARSGDKTMLERVEKAIDDEKDFGYPTEKRKKQILFASAVAGRVDNFKASDYEMFDSYVTVVEGIIFSHKKENWEKLSTEDLIKINPDDLYSACAWSNNSYVFQALQKIIKLRPSFDNVFIMSAVAGNYEEFSRLLPLLPQHDAHNIIKLQIRSQLIRSWRKSDNHKKCLEEFCRCCPEAVVEYFTLAIRSTEEGCLRNNQAKEVLFHLFSNFPELAKHLVTLLNATSRMDKWIDDVDDVEALLRDTEMDLSRLREQLPDLFTHQNLLTLFFRFGSWLASDTLLQKKCMTPEEMEKVKIHAKFIGDQLKHYFPSDLVRMIFSKL